MSVSLFSLTEVRRDSHQVQVQVQTGTLHLTRVQVQIQTRILPLKLIQFSPGGPPLFLHAGSVDVLMVWTCPHSVDLSWLMSLRGVKAGVSTSL